MLAAIVSQLREALVARKVPYPLVYGPERLEQGSSVRPHIVVERDRQSGDTWQAAKTNNANPQRIFARGIGGVVRIFAQSTKRGAAVEDHERIADKLVNQTMMALREIVVARRSALSIKSSRLLTLAELAEAGLTYPGAVYELRIEIGMGVDDENYAAETPAETTMGGEGGVSVTTTLDTSGSPEPTTDLPGAKTR